VWKLRAEKKLQTCKDRREKTKKLNIVRFGGIKLLPLELKSSASKIQIQIIPIQVSIKQTPFS
jgi:hypothetical protein